MDTGKKNKIVCFHFPKKQSLKHFLKVAVKAVAADPEEECYQRVIAVDKDSIKEVCIFLVLEEIFSHL